MNRERKLVKKLALLEVVKIKKDILFSSCQNNPVRKKQKEDSWNEVLAKAKSLGLASSNRTWTYARDNIFGLWKSRTLAKRNNYKKMGNGVGRTLDVVDETILDIIGSELPIVEEINFPEASDDEVSPFEPDISQIEFSPSSKKRKASFEPDIQVSQIEVSSSSRKKKAEADDDDDDITALKKELLKVEIYKTKLEALKLEQELGLSVSEFTKDFSEDESQRHSQMAKSLNFSRKTSSKNNLDDYF